MEDADSTEHGRWIYSAWKHLRCFASAPTTAAFEATAMAGRVCDLLGRMRELAPYTPQAIAPLVLDAAISRREFSQVIVPTLEQLNIFRVVRRGQDLESIAAVVLSQDDVMAQTSKLWKALLPDGRERAALHILRATADLPLTEAEAIEAIVSAGLDERDARAGIELALAHELVKKRHVADFRVDFLYNDFLWGQNIERTSVALGALPPDVRGALKDLLIELHEHEGRPVEEVESASPDMLRLAISQGIIDATEIVTSNGKKATFHFTPKFLGIGVSQADHPDTLDQVKLVIASFAFSTRYAQFKLRNPEQFLDSLIDRGYAGNATPIGTDYGALERQKIVDVEPVTAGSDRFRFRALKKDALIEARDTMAAGSLLLPSSSGSRDTLPPESQSFVDPVATRQRLAAQPGSTPLYDQQLLAAIRAAAQEERF